MSHKIIFLLAIHVSVSHCAGDNDSRSQCCRRVLHAQTIGYDIVGRPVTLDVGRCSTSCEEDNSFLESHYVSVLERIKNKKEMLLDEQMCFRKSSKGRASCEPSVVHVETISFGRDFKAVDVIDTCVCREVRKRCTRFPKTKRFFVGTEYEATVDIGECVGDCRKGDDPGTMTLFDAIAISILPNGYGKFCRAVRTATHPIIGPNGIITVQSIAECKCESSCFRQSFNVAVTEGVLNTTARRYDQRTRLIDVGRCTGTCGAIERCVVRSSRKGSLRQSASQCLMSLQTHDVECAPQRVHTVKYTNIYGKTARVSQIRRCGCE